MLAPGKSRALLGARPGGGAPTTTTRQPCSRASASSQPISANSASMRAARRTEGTWSAPAQRRSVWRSCSCWACMDGVGSGGGHRQPSVAGWHPQTFRPAMACQAGQLAPNPMHLHEHSCILFLLAPTAARRQLQRLLPSVQLARRQQLRRRRHAPQEHSKVCLAHLLSGPGWGWLAPAPEHQPVHASSRAEQRLGQPADGSSSADPATTVWPTGSPTPPHPLRQRHAVLVASLLRLQACQAGGRQAQVLCAVRLHAPPLVPAALQPGQDQHVAAPLRRIPRPAGRLACVPGWRDEGNERAGESGIRCASVGLAAPACAACCPASLAATAAFKPASLQHLPASTIMCPASARFLTNDPQSSPLISAIRRCLGEVSGLEG